MTRFLQSVDRRAMTALMAGTIATLSCSALAQSWDETTDGGGDAGQLLPGQITVGTGSLNFISGQISNPDTDVDLYCIYIPDEDGFSATIFETQPGLQSELWLFDAAGNGVAHAVDNAAPFTPSILPGLVNSPGIYFIGVSRRGLRPVDIGASQIFPTIGAGQTGPNPAGPLDSWAGTGSGLPGPYRIQFEGAEYHREPGQGGDGEQPDGGPWWTYNTASHFNYGNLFNLEVSVDATGQECLRLVDDPKAWPYVAVANSSRGTLTRIAVMDLPAYGISEGDVVGEYKTAPDGMGKNPSRTTVDGYGNVWVGNRSEGGSSGGQFKGSVTRIGLVIGGTRTDSTGTANPTGQYLQGPFEYCGCEDRDGDGLIKTSLGYTRSDGTSNADYTPTDLPWPNGGGADSDGGVTTAEDECITAYYRTEGTGVRHVAIDANNDIWVSGTGNREFELIDGSLATQITMFQGNCGGYGGLIDPDGILWSAQWGTTNLLRYDPVSTTQQCLPIPNYGLGVDTDCTTQAATSFAIWSSVANDPLAREITPAGVLANSWNHGSAATPRGVVVDNGSVYVAHSGTTNVGRITTGGLFLGNIPMTDTLNGPTKNGIGPHGVSADTNDKIWAPNRSTSNVMRIDPNLGAFGQVDLTVDLGSGAGPYNYSDMTGDLYLSIAPQGSWTFVHDGGTPGCMWGTLSWLEQITGNASISVRVRASDSPIPSGPWTDISNNVPFTGVMGQYLQVQVTINREIVDCMPDGEALLCELMICKESDCTVELDPVECDLDNPGTLNISGTFFNGSGKDGTRLLITPLPIGGGVTVDPNMINVNIPDGSSGTFNFNATGWTDGEEFCFIVTLFDETMQECCSVEVCVTPDCDCLQVRQSTVSVQCDPITGDYTVSFQVDNLTPDTVYHAYFFPPSGVTMTPNYVAFPGGIPPYTTSPVVTTVISGALPGEYCFMLSIHDELLNECCTREVCIDLPPCLIDPTGGDPQNPTGAQRLASPPFVHLDVGVSTACGPAADAVLSIHNNSDQPRSFDWYVRPETGVGCDHAIPQEAIFPESGTTAMLAPGESVDVPLIINTSSVPEDAVACLQAVIVDPADNFAVSGGGQILGTQVYDEQQGPVIRIAACNSQAGSILALNPGEQRQVSFTLDNVGNEPATLEYEIISSNPFVSLNGGEPGAAVSGELETTPGMPATLDLTVGVTGDTQGWVLDVILAARIANAGYPIAPQPLTAFSVRDASMGRCIADFNGDTVRDIDDVIGFLNAFSSGDPAADLSAAFGVLDIDDVLTFLDAFATGCAF